jgi:DMSO/TMAO reductase YedYZ molybdopterin-dependent catalytic subunit
MFIRNNGETPEEINIKTWTLTIDGESVTSKKTYTLADLKSKFKQHPYQLTLECGGNGRSEFTPAAKGNQWTIGAVHCASWTGVRLRDVLEDAGIKSDAVYIGYHATDTHLSGDLTKEPISRGCPMPKALQDETLLAFEMNGKDIPLIHGYPLRLVAGG